MRLTNGRSKEILTRGYVLLILVVAVTGRTSMGLAQSPGTFIATGDMNTPRTSHTATVLPNGKVLIAGGFSTTLPGLASVELYDPSTGTFTATGDMLAPRFDHTATLLPDGKILIAGGKPIVNTDATHGSAELYDPATGTFIYAGNMTTARARHTATLLNNGKVLITGGYDGGPGGCCSFASAELYDPSTGTFAATGSMTFRMQGHIATLLGNGRVLIEVGFSGDGVQGTELYDPGTGTFSLTGPAEPLTPSPFDPAIPATASLLMNGKVLVTFDSDDSPLVNAELYDPTTRTFTVTGDMTEVPRGGSTATLLPNGKVLIVGPDYWLQAVRVDLYDPATSTFSPIEDQPPSRIGHTATLLPDGTVLIAGGVTRYPGSGVSLDASAELYQPAVLVPAPVLPSLLGEQGAILHAGTSRAASSGDPATVGEVLEIYCIGLNDGSVIPPQVAIGGRMAEVLFFGKAAGFIGLNQINVRVPSGISPGPEVPVRLNYLARPSNEVTIAVQ